MKKMVIGMLAHVDAGKTTLTEAMLYKSNTIKKQGRVDRGDAFLDTHSLEKSRGITIFSKEARLKTDKSLITIIDTPGHIDFSAEMERTLQVLDAAILIVSSTDDITGHTRTLWQLLENMKVPVIIFVNKMDMDCPKSDIILKRLKNGIDNHIVDFSHRDEMFYENVAENDEQIFEKYMACNTIDDDDIASMIMERKIFPCLFGSALRLEGVDGVFEILDNYINVSYDSETFGARVYKISRDEADNRITHMKITGGTLKVKDVILGEKVNQIRMYSGSRYTAVSEALAGDICVVTGLNNTKAGEGVGEESGRFTPYIAPVLRYAVILGGGVDVNQAYSKLCRLGEEDPTLNITYNEELKEIEIELMGQVQTEVLKTIIKERFDMDVDFGVGHIVYKETITNVVEGIGHFEPLRHYAEVHLLLSPGEVGSGITFENKCSEDILDKNWQRLIKTHVFEREHRGVLIGAPLTDVVITLMSGKAHTKHTEGGDFRQATYRAIRQGLMKADSMLLEPYYDYILTVDPGNVGRAIGDIEAMCGNYEITEMKPEYVRLSGSAPVSTMCDYHKEVVSYTKGYGSLSLSLAGYGACHNPVEVINMRAYDPLSDRRGDPNSVFCAGGSGFIVPWNEVEQYMHLPSCIHRDSEETEVRTVIKQDLELSIGTEEIDAILARTFYANKKANGNRKGYARYQSLINNRESKPVKREILPKYLLVDGYNVIFAWDELNELAKVNIDAARDKLKDILCNYQGMKNVNVILVFDAYRVKGHSVSVEAYHNINVVYTKEAQTADAYIEKFTHDNKGKYDITVVTSDGLEQVIIRGAGCKLTSSREFKVEVENINREIAGTTTLW